MLNPDHCLVNDLLKLNDYNLEFNGMKTRIYVGFLEVRLRDAALKNTLKD